jgi:hypothetical protein
MPSPKLFNAVVFFAGCLPSLSVQIAWVNGFCAPWLVRNVNRFVTVVWAMSTIVDATAGLRFHTVLDLLVVLSGLRNWNRPKDDEPPRRRRKLEKKSESRTGLDWTGTEPVGSAA